LFDAQDCTQLTPDESTHLFVEQTLKDEGILQVSTKDRVEDDRAIIASGLQAPPKPMTVAAAPLGQNVPTQPDSPALPSYPPSSQSARPSRAKAMPDDLADRVSAAWAHKSSTMAAAPSARPPSASHGAVPHGSRHTTVTTSSERVRDRDGGEHSVDTIQVQSAPKTAVQSEDIWVLSAGEPIRDQVKGWGARAGWTVEWPGKLNWIIPATATFEGAFGDVDKGPVAQIVKSLAADGRPLHVQFHPGNHTIVVSGEGNK
jgi:hypothetical protein